MEPSTEHMDRLRIQKKRFGVNFPFEVEIQQEADKQSLIVYIESSDPKRLLAHLGNSPAAIQNMLMEICTDSAHTLNPAYKFEKSITALCTQRQIFMRVAFLLQAT